VCNRSCKGYLATLRSGGRAKDGKATGSRLVAFLSGDSGGRACQKSDEPEDSGESEKTRKAKDEKALAGGRGPGALCCCFDFRPFLVLILGS
jgi:hypothetical protein